MKRIYTSPFQAMRESWAVDCYTPKTTFWQDFSIADFYGIGAVKDTFKRAFEQWRDNVEYVTELCLVLNHKIWQHYDAGDNVGSRLYDGLWRQVDEWCCENLQGEDAEYFFRVTD